MDTVGSAGGFLSVKGESLSLFAHGGCWFSVNQKEQFRPALYRNCLEKTSVLMWCCIDKIDLSRLNN